MGGVAVSAGRWEGKRDFSADPGGLEGPKAGGRTPAGSEGYGRRGRSASANQHIRARLQTDECLLQSRDQFQQSREFGGRRVKNEHGKRQARRALLIRQVLVDGDERVKARCGERQKLAVLDARPPLENDG